MNKIIKYFRKKKNDKLCTIHGVSFEFFQELNGKPVQMDDRFESVHIWSEELALKNAGRWQPKLIDKHTYNVEKNHSWNSN